MFYTENSTFNTLTHKFMCHCYTVAHTRLRADVVALTTQGIEVQSGSAILKSKDAVVDMKLQFSEEGTKWKTNVLMLTSNLHLGRSMRHKGRVLYKDSKFANYKAIDAFWGFEEIAKFLKVNLRNGGLRWGLESFQL